MHDDAIESNEGTSWADRPTAKQRMAVQREVMRLFDDLAPERAPARAGAPVPAVQRHRSPRGCILQAERAAVSLSWFAALPTDEALGELQMIEWQGTVSLPGSARRSDRAAVAVREVQLQPVLGEAGVCTWRATDGTVYDTDALASHCRDLLERGSATATATEMQRAG
jgi:hypothetical protein